MSSSYIATGSEFAALCQSQMEILSRGLGAVWCAVYLTEELVESQPKKLIPFTIYPHSPGSQQQQLPSLRLPESSWYRLKSQPRLIANSLLKSETNQETGEVCSAKKQIILPLAYQDVVLGILVVGHKKNDWTQQELWQIEEIAKTLAIARFLDCSDRWNRQQLSKQKQIYRLERDRLDNLLHQLRNPLTALRTFSKLLIKRLLPEDRNQAVAQSILRESDRLQELLRQFEQEIERQEQNNESLTLNATPVVLSTEDNPSSSNFLLPSDTAKLELIKVKNILEPLLISAKAIADEKEIEISQNIPEDLPLVTANSQALREVLNNLIDNAIKYTPPGGKVSITIENQQLQSGLNYLGIAIKDTGYGIPVQDREHIFERHYRGIQAEGDIDGSGLGLAIAKELVEQMQGQIKLISPNNFAQDSEFPGTTFIVLLPLSVNN